MGCCLFKSGFRFTPYLAVGPAYRKCRIIFPIPYSCAGVFPNFRAKTAEAISDAICSSQILGTHILLPHSLYGQMSVHHAEAIKRAACASQAFG